MNSFEIGRAGEAYAAEYLKKKRFQIVTQNYKCTVGEIDIIAKTKTEIVFVEVKARRSISHGAPSEYINKDKLSHLTRAAHYFIRKYDVKLLPRIDVIELYIQEDNNGQLIVDKIEHLEKVTF
jgi:putative endonuclease